MWTDEAYEQAYQDGYADAMADVEAKRPTADAYVFIDPADGLLTNRWRIAKGAPKHSIERLLSGLADLHDTIMSYWTDGEDDDDDDCE